MTQMSRAIEAIAAGLGDRARDLRTLRQNELHCTIASEDVLVLARHLRADLQAELVLMAADDRRADRQAFLVHYLFAQPRENWFVHATASLDPLAPALTSLSSFHYPASRFEREIADLFGIVPTGHLDPRPLVRHGFWPPDYFPLRKDAGPREFTDDGQPFPFGEVRGEGVYEIPVGPVHAGIIEPGHFRFSVVGETIIDMKSRLYFTHKGTEKLFEGRRPADGLELAERISGDTAVGHALAYCQAIESAAHVRVPHRANYLRVILLELERLYNHVADCGAIAADTGFAVAQSHCLRIRERLLRLNKRVTGHRLLRGGVVPGGVAVDLPPGLDLDGEVRAAVQDFEDIVEISLGNTMLMDRLDGTGRLTTRTARGQGVVGIVARASGIDADVRRDHPFAAYADLSFDVPVFESGDVKARTLVRVEEVRQSARLIHQAVGRLESAKDGLAVPVTAFQPFEPAFGIVEAWRGAVIHWVAVDREMRLHRVKIVDPSFLNWRSLSYALIENIVPDFPLCNKSYNQSYSGNDL